jgi:murein DD-endopeptidase MepM/ murein hydrolase activator NlpD
MYRKTASFVNRGLVLLFVLALLAVSLPQPALAATCSRNYTVVAGDTISNVAETFKVSVQELATANTLASPYTIFVGQVLCIPATAATTTSTTTTTSSSNNTNNDPTLELSIIGNKLLIEGSHFGDRNTFYVRAGEKGSQSNKSIKLGRVRSLKDGLVDGLFLLPKGLRNTKIIVVCLKNVENDDLFCGRIVQSKK